jgi:glycosyltransferase involved in cell wall biosynthesis
MKVLHVIPSLSAVHGGPSVAMPLIERALRTEGVTVETATTDDDGAARWMARPLSVAVTEAGLQRWYFHKNTDFYKCSWSFGRWIARHAADYDLLHVHALFSFVSTAAIIAARRAGVPYVVRPLGTLSRYGLAQRRPLIKRLSLGILESRFLRDAAAVHFTSEDEATEAFAALGTLRGEIIPLGVTVWPIAPARTPHGPALFLSRLDPKKNVESLLRGFAHALAKRPSLRLVVAGSGDPAYVKALHALSEQLGLRDAVEWAGHVEGERKARLLADAAVFVLPSFSENFGIAAAEALAAGLPCVLGKGVALAARVETAGAGMAIEPDPSTIASALLHLFNNPDWLAQCSLCARGLAVQELSLEAMGRRMRELYERILEQRAAT